MAGKKLQRLEQALADLAALYMPAEDAEIAAGDAPALMVLYAVHEITAARRLLPPDVRNRLVEQARWGKSVEAAGRPDGEWTHEHVQPWTCPASVGEGEGQVGGRRKPG